MSELRIDEHGTLLIDGAWRPIVTLGASVTDGDLDVETRRPQEGSESEHVISGWTVRSLEVELRIYERSGHYGERWRHAAALREVQTRRQPADARLPEVWSFVGDLAAALDLRQVLVIGLDRLTARSRRNDILCTLRMLEVNPTIAIVTAQASAAPADAPAESEQTTALTADDSEYLTEALRQPAAGDTP